MQSQPQLFIPPCPHDFCHETEIVLTEEIESIFPPFDSKQALVLALANQMGGRDNVPVPSLPLKNLMCFYSVRCHPHSRMPRLVLKGETCEAEKKHSTHPSLGHHRSAPSRGVNATKACRAAQMTLSIRVSNKHLQSHATPALWLVVTQQQLPDIVGFIIFVSPRL